MSRPALGHCSIVVVSKHSPCVISNTDMVLICSGHPSAHRCVDAVPERHPVADQRSALRR